jgi:tetratricopeptide (TPR) repeat protein
VVCFGISSAIDWTWFVPATAVPALICAGWLAGRGPPDAPVGRVDRRRALLSHPALPLSGTAVVAVALGLAWGIWQPLRSVQAENAAFSAAAAGQAAAAAGNDALAERDGAAAFADARAAVDRDPFSLDAMTALASLYAAAGDLRRARAELVLETQRQPQNFASWYQLGDFDFHHGLLADAGVELSRSAHLNPFNVPTAVDEGEASAERNRLHSGTVR